MSSTTTPVSVSKCSTTATPEAPVQKSGDKEPMTTSLPSLADVKDRRAYEHGRQKVKKAADFVKMKTQKARVVIDPSWPRVPQREKEKFLVVYEEVDSDAVLVDNGRDGVVSEVKFDVKLADLITTRKSLTRKDSDFEVIPHLRSVIVLDDVATHDVSIDEPWEHVFGDDEAKLASVKAPSYATILSSPK